MEEKPRMQLSAIQVVGGGLAAATAAVGASFLGVGGTVAGAAVVSILTSVGGAVYTHSYNRGKYAVQRARTRHGTGDTTRIPMDAATGTTPRVEPTRPTTKWAEPPESDAPAPHRPATTRADGDAGPGADGETTVENRPKRRINPAAFVLTGAFVLVLSLALVTGLEGVIGKPISAALSGHDSGDKGTTLGTVVRDGTGGGSKGGADSSPTPTATPTGTGESGSTSAPATSRPAAPATSRPPTSQPATSRPAPATSAPAPTRTKQPRATSTGGGAGE